jgi:hypothetical protein
MVVRFFQSAHSCHPFAWKSKDGSSISSPLSNFQMIKETPNPPEADDVSPYESADSKKFNEAAERALDHYLNPAALKSPANRKPSTMFLVAPDIKDEDLLAHTCESLAQASVMASDFAGYLEGPHRHTAMAIQQIVMLAELAVNRMLDNVELPKPAPHC